MALHSGTKYISGHTDLVIGLSGFNDNYDDLDYYRKTYGGTPDIIYQDIAQRNQVQIFNENSKKFKNARKAMLIIKARAISSNRPEKSIVNSAIREIKDFKVKEIINLKPYDIGNYFVYLER